MPVYLSPRLLRYGAGVDENVMPFGSLGAGYVNTSGAAVAARARANTSRAPAAQRNVYTAQLMQPSATSAWTAPASIRAAPVRSASVAYQRPAPAPMAPAPSIRPAAAPKPTTKPVPKPPVVTIPATPPTIAQTEPAKQKDLDKEVKNAATSAESAVDVVMRRLELEKASIESDGKILGMSKKTAIIAGSVVAGGILLLVMNH